MKSLIPSASDEQSAIDRVLDMSVVTSELIHKNESAGDFLHRSFDSRRVAWTGHSFGASTVLMAGAADLCTTLLAGVSQIASECGPDPKAAHAAVTTVVTAALARYLSCDPEANAWLEPSWRSAAGKFCRGFPGYAEG